VQAITELHRMQWVVRDEPVLGHGHQRGHIQQSFAPA
jgi:creatinine amidohydrolase